MRIDVQLPLMNLQADLDKLHRRMQSPQDALHGLPALQLPVPGLVFRYREADGEFYVYVEDPARQRLAGMTVFNRLIELDRVADRYLRAPHSRYAADYQRRGIATAVYRWALNAGMCLLSAPRQSPGAYALWLGLARQYELGYVQLRDKALRYLGPRVSREELEEFHTRMVLFGSDWSVERFVAATRCERDELAVTN